MKRVISFMSFFLFLIAPALVGQTIELGVEMPEVQPIDEPPEIPEIPLIPVAPSEETGKENPVTEESFVPVGGIAFLKDQADIDLFTQGKNIGHVQDDPRNTHRRLVQRTIMPTESLTSAGAVLTFDDYLVADSPKMGSAIDIVKDLAPLNTRAIFFANVNGVSGTDISRILRKKISNDAKKELVEKLLARQKKEFVTTIRSLIKVQGSADKDGNREYICEVFNHTAFHQDMKRMKVGSLKYEICVMGIDFIEKCLDEAYKAERPNWERARYFRFPFLHVPRDKATKVALNKKFTEHGLVAVGETQDSKDFTNYSSKTAYRSLAAAKRNRRYNPKYGEYGEAEKPVALFHTKTWKKIRSGVISAIKEK